jgi:hypothetical protein
MNSIFVMVDKHGNKTVVDKDSTVFLVKESAFIDAECNDVPLGDIHSSLCEEYNLDTLLFLGYRAGEEHIFDGDLNVCK